jgi:hypothetical protein
MPRHRGIWSISALVQRVTIGDGGLILVLGEVGIDRSDVQLDSRV